MHCLYTTYVSAPKAPHTWVCLAGPNTKSKHTDVCRCFFYSSPSCAPSAATPHKPQPCPFLPTVWRLGRRASHAAACVSSVRHTQQQQTKHAATPPLFCHAPRPHASQRRLRSCMPRWGPSTSPAIAVRHQAAAHERCTVSLAGTMPPPPQPRRMPPLPQPGRRILCAGHKSLACSRRAFMLRDNQHGPPPHPGPCVAHSLVPCRHAFIITSDTTQDKHPHD